MTNYKYIKGYNELYRISEIGDVQSCHMKGTHGKRGAWWSMSKPLDANGYQLVYLWDKINNKRVRRLVH